MRPLLAATALAVIVAGPAFPMSHGADPATLTCADFLGMDRDGRMAAMQELEPALESRESTDREGTSDETEEMAENAEADSDAGGAMETTESGDAMESDDRGATAMTGGADMSAEAMAEHEQEMQQMVEACMANPERLAVDAMVSDM